MTARISNITPGDPLTARERQVLTLVAQGFPSAPIGRRLGYSEDGAKALLRAAMRKLDVHDRVSAALTAVQLGLIDPPACDEAVWVPAAGVRDVVDQWRGRAPAALLAELGRLCGDQPVRRVS